MLSADVKGPLRPVAADTISAVRVRGDLGAICTCCVAGDAMGVVGLGHSVRNHGLAAAPEQQSDASRGSQSPHDVRVRKMAG